MTRRSVCGVGAVFLSAAILAALVLSVGPAGATPPAGETIVLTRDANLNPSGWNAYGPTFYDSGSWGGVFGAFAPDSAPLFVGLLKTMETSSGGSFELNFQVLTNPVGSFGGECQLTGETGTYVGYHGIGTWQFSNVGANRYYTCTLTVHQDR